MEQQKTKKSNSISLQEKILPMLIPFQKRLELFIEPISLRSWIRQWSMLIKTRTKIWKINPLVRCLNFIKRTFSAMVVPNSQIMIPLHYRDTVTLTMFNKDLLSNSKEEQAYKVTEEIQTTALKNRFKKLTKLMKRHQANPTEAWTETRKEDLELRKNLSNLLSRINSLTHKRSNLMYKTMRIDIYLNK